MSDAMDPHRDTPTSYAIVLDDHPLVGRGMAQYLQSVAPRLQVSVATQWAEVQQLRLERGAPALLVADVWLAHGNCLPFLAQWVRDCSDSPWIAVSGDDDPAIARRVRAAGARGFVHKQASPEQFGAALRAVLGGGQWFGPEPEHPPAAPAPRAWSVSPQELGLTPRQGEILRLVLRGMPNKRIASTLGISEATVKEHITGILERLGVRNRVEVITLLRGRRVELP